MDIYIATCRNKGCPNKDLGIEITVESGEPEPLVNCGPCGGKPITDIINTSV
jgi:hypothetical protein